MRSRAISFLGLSLIWLQLAGGASHAQQAPLTEYQLKAAFLFNFAKFVEWPGKAFADTASPMVVGILGESPLKENLAPMIRDKTIDGHRLEIKEFVWPAQPTNCHILFISNSEKKHLPEIIESMKGASVLTVGETENFIAAGGMINFFLEGTKMRFQISQPAATGGGLKISSKLLSLSSRPGG